MKLVLIPSALNFACNVLRRFYFIAVVNFLETPGRDSDASRSPWSGVPGG
jgi:hypothetical protein